jgi:High potential iron-sulfur protein
MQELQKVWSVELSRRRMLQRAASAGGAVVILASSVQSAMAGKIPQSAVAYQGSPKGPQSCANCRLFEPPSACKTVDGTVSASGWCRIYVKA